MLAVRVQACSNQQVALTGIVGELTAADILRFARLPCFADDGISAGLEHPAGLNKRRVGRNGLRVVNKRVGDGFVASVVVQPVVPLSAFSAPSPVAVTPP